MKQPYEPVCWGEYATWPVTWHYRYIRSQYSNSGQERLKKLTDIWQSCQKKRSTFNKWFWRNWMPTYTWMKIDPSLSLCTQIDSKWIKDLNLKPESIRLLGENIDSHLQGRSIEKDFLNRVLSALEFRATIDKGGLIKLNCFLTDKEIISLSKRKSTSGRKSFPVILLIDN